MASLPIALAKSGNDVMVVAPRYGHYQHMKKCDAHVSLQLFGRNYEVSFYHEKREEVDWVFVDNQEMFMR